jgi:hypothetical protein
VILGGWGEEKGIMAWVASGAVQQIVAVVVEVVEQGRSMRSFSRLCDLNKHAKSHSRPYKCNDPTCKYNTLGWPTARELERHYNDNQGLGTAL